MSCEKGSKFCLVPGCLANYQGQLTLARWDGTWQDFGKILLHLKFRQVSPAVFQVHRNLAKVSPSPARLAEDGQIKSRVTERHCLGQI